MLNIGGVMTINKIINKTFLGASFVFALVLFGSCTVTIGEGSSQNENGSEKNDIYGEDDRKDPKDLPYTIWDKWAESTALLVYKSDLIPDGQEYHTLNSQKFGDIHNLCNDVNFIDQPSVGFCSSFLVGQNLVATAGHCIEQKECSDIAVVFGYGYYTANKNNDVLRIPNENIYYCKSPIIAQEYHQETFPQDQQYDELGGVLTDYAVFQLDRNVLNRIPFKVRNSGRVEVGTPVVAIGHPFGLPTKISRGQVIYAPSFRKLFFIDTDVFPGNSGSALINEISGEIEGIVVTASGHYFEYFPSEGCNRHTHCADVDPTQVECIGIGVTHAEVFAPFLNVGF